MASLSGLVKWPGRLAGLSILLFTGGLLLGESVRPVSQYLTRESSSLDELDPATNLEMIRRSVASLEERVVGHVEEDTFTDVLARFDRRIGAIEDALAALDPGDTGAHDMLASSRSVLLARKRKAVLSYAEDLANRTANEALLAEVAQMLEEVSDRDDAENLASLNARARTVSAVHPAGGALTEEQ